MQGNGESMNIRYDGPKPPGKAESRPNGDDSKKLKSGD